jgi:hypothetical protein
MERQENAIDNPPLWTARRISAQTSTFDLPAHKLIQVVIQYFFARKQQLDSFWSSFQSAKSFL